jgi:hypothetical protein
MYHRHLFLISILSGAAAAFLYPEGVLSRPLSTLTTGDALRLGEVALLAVVALFFLAGGIYTRLQRRYWKLVESQMRKRINRDQIVSGCDDYVPPSGD